MFRIKKKLAASQSIVFKTKDNFLHIKSKLFYLNSFMKSD